MSYNFSHFPFDICNRTSETDLGELISSNLTRKKQYRAATERPDRCSVASKGGPASPHSDQGKLWGQIAAKLKG